MISALLFSSNDWHRYIIESPLTSAPGEAFNYNTALTHLLSGIITRTKGESTLSYANSRLFDPLGITCQRWSLDPRGYYFGGSEVWLTARDLAKFGLLVLRNGRWEDRQIVSGQWLRDSTRLSVRTGADGGDYGWLWWKYTLQGYPLTIASGYGGQYVFLLPELDLMMVTTARSNIPNQPNLVYSQPYELFWRFVIPAVTVPAPNLTAGGVINAADYGTRFAPGVFASAFGSDFSVVTRDWGSVFPSDGRLPDALAGVRIRIGGRVAYPAFVSPTQVNFLIPPDMAPGRHKVEIITPQGRSSQDVEVGESAPAFFSTWREGRAFVKPAPVRAGETIELWSSGLGASDPAAPVGTALDHPLPLAAPPEVTIGGEKAQVVYAALAYPGVCQVNVRVPENVPPGLAAVELRTSAGIKSRDAFLEIAP
jgi:uncharacterized protein (TIGR03437 family)